MYSPTYVFITQIDDVPDIGGSKNRASTLKNQEIIHDHTCSICDFSVDNFEDLKKHFEDVHGVDNVQVLELIGGVPKKVVVNEGMLDII